MDDPNVNELSSFKRFLELFCRDVEEPSSADNDSVVRHVSYMLEPSEIEGESLQWALNYLNVTHECPHGLAEQVAREAFKRLAHRVLQGFFDNRKGDSNSKGSQSASGARIENRRLQREVEVETHQICREWNEQLPSNVQPPGPVCKVSVHAIKNTRRRMEDRHVVLSDLNTLFQLQNCPSQSYYAVFDGHGGAEAAMFCANQLHVNLLRDTHFNSAPEMAIKRAYIATDRQFLRKAEEMKLRSGTTCVTVLMRGEHCYVSWLGDSQVMLVREGRAITLMEPHTPARQDEKKRIEDLGGFVTNAFGVWRVNNNISVSRAIGDMNEKPFLCSDADVASFECTGTEDYLVLACDGVWDVLDPLEVPFLVHTYLRQNPDDHRNVARHLVIKSKEKGSGDNISCVVVFMRKDVAEPVGIALEGLHFLRENGEHPEECASEFSGSHLGSGESITSGSTGISRLTLGSTAMGSSDAGGDFTKSSLYSVGQQIESDFPHRLERQTGFFVPSHRSLRTGNHRQQLLPLQEEEKSRATVANQNGSTVDSSRREELTQMPKPVKGGSKRAPARRKPKQKRQRMRTLRSDSPDSSAVDCLSVDQSDSLSVSSFVPARTLAKHTSLTEIMQQMSDSLDENVNPYSRDPLKVQGTSACLHNMLPRISSQMPRNLKNLTTSVTPLSVARLSSRHPDHAHNFPQTKGRSQPYNS